jgi:uncharacterized protein (TIGR02145 family)
MTLNANVTKVGTWDIATTVSNGVTFSGSGTFTTTGCQSITLTASGTPLAEGPLVAVTNTSPQGTATTTVKPVSNASTNGTAVVSNYGNSTCATGSVGTINGTLTKGVVVSGVTMSLYANVTQIGSWSLSASQNGVTFTGSGTFTATGCQVITLTGTGTPTNTGSTTFTTNGTPSGSATATVVAGFSPSGITAGGGSLAGRTCFDIALSNDNTNSCGSLSSRTANQANFTLSSINTQSYTFTPSGSVSNVRFYYINDVGNAVVAISGGNTGNNISTAVTATVNFNTNNNSLALGLTSSNALTSRIFVVYNANATATSNPADDRVLSLTANVKDCACCGAFIAPNVFKDFLCHNLGADITLDPNVPNIGLFGAKIQWGKRGPNITGDSRIDWQTAPNDGALGFSAAPTAANTNTGAISGWSETPAVDGSWVDYFKTIYDPCPAGYRVPSAAEWKGVLDNNTLTKTGSFAASNTNFTSALHIGPNASSRTLTLPAAGLRGSTNNVTYGSLVMYTSSTSVVTGNNAASYTFYYDGTTSQVAGGSTRVGAFSVRCIVE